MSPISYRHPLVSVVISAYNASEYITETVSSFISQTYPFWEMIIVNDGSTDDTSAIVHALSAKDRRIRYIDQDNSGMTLARKAGIDIARGKYVLVFDSDDIIYPDAFQKLVDIAEHTAADVVSVPFRFWYPDGRRVDSVKPDWQEIDGIEYLRKAFEEKAYWALWQNFMRKELLLNADFNIGRELRLGEDMVIDVQIMDADTRVVSCPLPLIDYRMRDDSVSHRKTDRFFQDYRRSLDISEAILQNRKNIYHRLRKSIATARVDRCLSGIFLGDTGNIEMDLHSALRYLLRFPSLWLYLRRKDKTMVRLMRKYLSRPQKAIAWAYQIAYNNTDKQ